MTSLDSDLVDRFQRDGAVMIPGVLDEHWLDLLARGIAWHLEHPSHRATDYARDDAAGEHYIYDAVCVPDNPHYQDYVEHSPIGAVAARLMRSPIAVCLDLNVFVRSPGTRARTPWHRDQVSWSAESAQTVSIWTSLDPVPSGTELEMVLGSHRWPETYDRPNFAENNLGGVYEVQGHRSLPVPDFGGEDRGRYDIACWPMSPGDVLAFHGMTFHGGGGGLPGGLARRAVSAQWLDGNAHVTSERAGGCNPDLLPEFARHGIRSGDFPGSAMCPVVKA